MPMLTRDDAAFAVEVHPRRPVGQPVNDNDHHRSSQSQPCAQRGADEGGALMQKRSRESSIHEVET